jgi:hypothetical protein
VGIFPSPVRGQCSGPGRWPEAGEGAAKGPVTADPEMMGDAGVI